MRDHKLNLSAFILFAIAALGCGSDDAPHRSIDVTRADVRAAVVANQTFALSLLDALHETQGNLLYSPLSVQVALGMLYAGTGGDTASQLKAALGAGDDTDAFHRGLGAVLGDLRSASGQGYTLDLANRLFTQADLPVLRDFSAKMANFYAAPEQPLDFSADLEAARTTIDHWVEQQTQGRISQLFQPGDLNPGTVMVVVSALFFKAEWAHGFPSSATRAAPFHRADGSSVEAQMMTMPELELEVGGFGDTQVVAFPYRDSMLSFVALLPAAADGAPALEHALATKDLRVLRAELERGKVLLTLPRFELDVRMDLIPVLQKLGVTDLFDAKLADLSRIDGKNDLFVRPLLHEATIHVDETGTVAAAATGAGVLRSAPTQLFFDHPFVFFIYDDLTGAVLFTGRVSDPSGSK